MESSLFMQEIWPDKEGVRSHLLHSEDASMLHDFASKPVGLIDSKQTSFELQPEFGKRIFTVTSQPCNDTQKARLWRLPTTVQGVGKGIAMGSGHESISEKRTYAMDAC